jgi:hypothetical protein
MKDRTPLILGLVALGLLFLGGIYWFSQQKQQKDDGFHLRIDGKSGVIVQPDKGRVSVPPFVDVEWENNKK